MTLDDIKDQPRAVTLLRRALQNDRVAHAYAFVGPAGTGRTTTALAFAAALICPTAGRHDGKPCRPCALTQLTALGRQGSTVAARQHPDLHVIVPTPPEKNPKGPRSIRIDEIRELERVASLKPLMATRKLFIIDDADRMTDDTPQAFLKTLEEPPAATVMILVLNRVSDLPATVLSRCQIVRFAPRGEGDREAYAEAVAILDDVRAKGADALFRKAQNVDRARAERLVDAYWLLQRDWLLAKVGAPATLLTDPARADATAREADARTVEDILAGIATCRQARAALMVNVAPRLTLEVIVSQLTVGAAGGNR